MPRYLLPRKLFGSFLALSLLAIPAQGSAAQETMDAPADADDDDGFDEGLLGLLGLAGLLGLRGRDKTRTRTDR